MREEVLVLRGEDRITNNGRDVFILDVPPVLSCHLDERLTIGIVNMADRRKFKRIKGSMLGRLVRSK